MPKRSHAWDFFEKQSGKVICSKCKGEVKTTGNTSNMLRHLENHHIDLFLTHFKGQNVKQRRIDTSMNMISSIKSGDLKSTIDEKLIWWIIDDSRPFNMVESKAFKSFIKSLNSNYDAPGRKSVTDKIEKLYGTKKELVISHLKMIRSFTLTTDLWTDTTNTRSYIGLTIHFIDNYVPIKLCLAAKEFPHNHSAQNISTLIKDILDQFEIDIEIIFATVTDSAANMKLAMKDISANHIGCVAHKLNLVVTDSLEFDRDLVNLIVKIRTIVTYFKQSNKASLALIEEQKKDGVDQLLKLKQDVLTRWNSTYIMIERMLKLRNYVSLSLRKLLREDLDLDYREIEQLNDVMLLLKPFYQMTLDMSGENYVTISRVIPLVTMVFNLLNTIQTTTYIGATLKAKLVSNLEERFANIERNHLFAFSTILDPRFKLIDFRSPGDSALAVSKLNRELKEVNLTQVIVPEPESELNLWSLHNNLVSRITTVDSSLNSSLKHYLELKNIDLKDDPLDFWKRYKENFHHLHNIAIKYLNIPATSVPCERLFSKTGQIINEKRNRISPSHVNALCFLESLPEIFR
ncbi:zinc finger BED domain-containing protein 1-like [Tetranychus urticae]|uniref:zinc finger BED domain-containing protein 1-like n=1 Tax=Tetranychus urticae TaxID=32264 RepID=UPI00077BC739|nr:zinc finger BED domain-containing protein 1-like [Tetranychus urticae]